jgi:hypothetical protein
MVVFRSVPCVPADLDGILRYEDTEFPVLTSLLLTLSNHDTLIQPGPGSGFLYRITSKVALNSVAEFVKLFTLGECRITAENAVDLLVLSQELRVTSAITKIIEFLGNNSIELLIVALERQLSDFGDSSELEIALSHQLLDNSDNVNLHRLPLPCLDRVLGLIPHDLPESRHKLFKFCLLLFDRLGPNTSLLFRHFDFRDLTGQEIEALVARPTFIWSFLGGSIHATLHSWNALTLEFLRVRTMDRAGKNLIVDRANRLTKSASNGRVSVDSFDLFCVEMQSCRRLKFLVHFIRARDLSQSLIFSGLKQR